ncbi:MAG: hypothetical protein KJO12_05865, partial [Ignavibacteria bacterium]|nr:hypothetical protein [Ignavibacteria bacterium]
MKKLLILSLFSVLFFFGCNQESEITSPVNNSTNPQLKLISLPTPSGGLNVETDYTVYKEIDGEDGGTFYAEYTYQGSNGNVSQASHLYFPEDAFDEEETISQTFSTVGAAMVFGPAMQFQEQVIFSYKVTGLDLTGLNPETLDFVYIDANGNMYPVEYS